MDMATETDRPKGQNLAVRQSHRRADVLVRLATHEEVGAIMSFLMMQRPEFPFLEVNHVKALSNIRLFIEKGFVLIVEVDGQIAGSAALVADQFWYSDDWIITDFWIFIAPKFRRTVAAVELLKSIRELARKIGLPTFVAVRSLKQVHQKNKLFRRYFRPVGELFLCEFPEERT